MDLTKQCATQLQTIREAYTSEVVKLAEELRPRFEAGELADSTDSDFGPKERLEAACVERFGLETRKVRAGVYEGGDRDLALLILYLSPSSDTEEVNRGEQWVHECLAAAAAVTLDVLAVATERGWTRRVASPRARR